MTDDPDAIEIRFRGWVQKVQPQWLGVIRGVRNPETMALARVRHALWLRVKDLDLTSTPVAG